MILHYSILAIRKSDFGANESLNAECRLVKCEVGDTSPFKIQQSEFKLLFNGILNGIANAEFMKYEGDINNEHFAIQPSTFIILTSALNGILNDECRMQKCEDI